MFDKGDAWVVFKHDSFWDPDEQVVKRAFEDLALQVRSIDREDISDADVEYIIETFDTRYVQCVGYVLNGELLIRLNFFPSRENSDDTDSKNWKITYIDGMDGGPDFWRVDYAPSSRSFRNLRANGVA